MCFATLERCHQSIRSLSRFARLRKAHRAPRVENRVFGARLASLAFARCIVASLLAPFVERCHQSIRSLSRFARLRKARRRFAPCASFARLRKVHRRFAPCTVRPCCSSPRSRRGHPSAPCTSSSNFPAFRHGRRRALSGSPSCGPCQAPEMGNMRKRTTRRGGEGEDRVSAAALPRAN